MKMKFILLSVALVGCAVSGLIAWSQDPADEGAANRARADQIMSQTFGKDWLDLLITSETNRAQVKFMAATYETAIGYHRAK